MSVNPEERGAASIHHRRVRAVFRGDWPDRFPICEQAFASSVAAKLLGRQVCTGSTEVHFLEGLAWLEGEQAHGEFVEKLYADSLALARFLDFDIWHLPWRMQARPVRRVDACSLLYGDPEGDEWLIRRFDPVSRTYGVAASGRPPPTFEDAARQMRRAIEDAGRGEWEPALDPLLERALREHGDELVVAGGGGMAVPVSSGWLEATELDPGLLAEWLDVGVERGLRILSAQRDAGVQLINGGGDFAFNSGPVYSPRFFESVMAPRWKRYFDRCRELGLWYVMRSDGNLWPVADSLFGWARPHAYAECDYDAGMRFSELRERFPDLVLIGNVSCALLLAGTPQQVRDRAMECLGAAAPRFIGGSANSILHGTPPENVLALFGAIKSPQVAPVRTGRRDGRAIPSAAEGCGCWPSRCIPLSGSPGDIPAAGRA